MKKLLLAVAFLFAAGSANAVTFNDLPAGSTSTAGSVPVWQSGAVKLQFSAFFAGLPSIANNADFLTAIGAQPAGSYATLLGAQTLTNKTISGASNTLSAIANASLTNSAITIAGTSTALGGSITATTILNSIKGQVPGTATNDSASAGNAGEYISCSATAVSATTGTNLNICTMSLTAGDWDVTANVHENLAGTTAQTVFQGWTNTVSVTAPSSPNDQITQLILPFTTGANQQFAISRHRYSLATTTTIYLSARADFTVSTLTFDGVMSARRAR